MYSVHDLLAEGFPHSDIRGSTIARISPRLFAACHVLHRLLAPRHPPNALVTLTLTTTARAQDQTAPYPLRGTPRPRPKPSQQQLNSHHATHISKADRSPRSPSGLPDNAARLRSTKSDSPFERTCPTLAVRPAPGNLLREAGTEQTRVCSRHHFGSKPAPEPRNPEPGNPGATKSRSQPCNMEANGFEPMTPCLQSRCSTS